MSSEKRLNSVCHNIAHHSLSGVSWIHPHLAQASRRAGLDHAEIDLLGVDPCPQVRGLRHTKTPLHLGLTSLQMRFAVMLKAEGFELSDVSEAYLKFESPTEHSWYFYCTSTIVSVNGRQSRYKLDMSGKTVGE